MVKIFAAFKGIWNRWQQPISLHKDDLETLFEYQQRWRSIRIMYFTTFLMSLGFSIIIIGIWPYLNKLDPNAGKVFIGYVIAAQPLGQMLFSPLFGHWGNKVKSILFPMYVTIGIFCLASVMFSCLDAFPSSSAKYFMTLSRFLLGVGSANITICRAYIAEATRESERTGAISMTALANVMGTVIGPALQSCVTPLGENGIVLIPGLVILNVFTATGWINVAMSIINLVLCLPIFFKEKRISAKEVMVKEGLTTEEETYKDMPIDYVAVWTILIGLFVACFDATANNTVCTPMAMDQYAWSRVEALYYVSLVISVGSFVSLISFFIVPALCRRFSERNVLIFVGFAALVIGRGLNIPFLGGSPPKMAENLHFSNDAITGIAQNYTSDSSNVIELVGCPISQEWCRTTPALPIAQFCIGLMITSIGYPITFSLLQTIFSKVLGCRPQGVWIGVFFAFGCMARAIAPIFIGRIYAPYGMYWTFGSLTFIALIGMFWTWLIRNRLRTPNRNIASHETAKIESIVTVTRL